MLSRFAATIVVVLVTSCASQPQKHSTQWQKSEIVGLTITLDDPIKEEWYSFNKDGSVAATYGEKNGWITSPLYFWKIRDGELMIFDYDKKPFQSLTLLSREKKTLKVKEKHGKTVLFNIIQA